MVHAQPQNDVTVDEFAAKREAPRLPRDETLCYTIAHAHADIRDPPVSTMSHDVLIYAMARFRQAKANRMSVRVIGQAARRRRVNEFRHD